MRGAAIGKKNEADCITDTGWLRALIEEAHLLAPLVFWLAPLSEAACSLAEPVPRAAAAPAGSVLGHRGHDGAREILS